MTRTDANFVLWLLLLRNEGGGLGACSDSLAVLTETTIKRVNAVSAKFHAIPDSAAVLERIHNIPHRLIQNLEEIMNFLLLDIKGNIETTHLSTANQSYCPHELDGGQSGLTASNTREPHSGLLSLKNWFCWRSSDVENTTTEQPELDIPSARLDSAPKLETTAVAQTSRPASCDDESVVNKELATPLGISPDGMSKSEDVGDGTQPRSVDTLDKVVKLAG
jgi:hypothetical protein